jgi:hypothetical protein
MRKRLAFAAAGLVVAWAPRPLGAQAPAAAPAPAVQAASPAAAAPEQPSGAKVWIGRYGEFEDFLRSAGIAKLSDIPVGVTHPQRAFFAPGGIAGSAALKHLQSGLQSGYWESYKSEIAAYKLDRILGLNMVPPTVERRVGADLASMQLWVEDCKLLKDVDQKASPDKDAWAKQVWRQRTFDNLIANIDRNAGNLLVDDHWNLILIDHSRAFATNGMPFMKEMTRIDRAFYERLKALDEATLMRELKPWVLTGGNVKDVLKRRDKIVARFDELARQTSAAAVFPF